jgi:RNA polymerase sigma factor (TIGR02999 family)
MSPPIQSDVTQLLLDWQRGNKRALDQLMPLVYRELRKLAASYLKDERRNHTLQPTALIHESYLRMVEQDMPEWKSRAHFFGVAARLMRQILVDHARLRGAVKRGGEYVKISLDDAPPTSIDHEVERILTLDAALTKLARFDERKSQVVEMRVFGGMKLSDIAVALNVSEPTVKRDMRLAKAWLRVEVGLLNC